MVSTIWARCHLEYSRCIALTPSPILFVRDQLTYRLGRSPGKLAGRALILKGKYSSKFNCLQRKTSKPPRRHLPLIQFVRLVLLFKRQKDERMLILHKFSPLSYPGFNTIPFCWANLAVSDMPEPISSRTGNCHCFLGILDIPFPQDPSKSPRSTLQVLKSHLGGILPSPEGRFTETVKNRNLTQSSRWSPVFRKSFEFKHWMFLHYLLLKPSPENVELILRIENFFLVTGK